MHVSNHATISDHCSTYALSDPKDEHLRNECDHRHEDSCPQCENLKSAFKEVSDAAVEATLSEDERDDILCTVHQAMRAIVSWKAHQLRSL